VSFESQVTYLSFAVLSNIRVPAWKSKCSLGVRKLKSMSCWYLQHTCKAIKFQLGANASIYCNLHPLRSCMA
jgi:hypothetical protein